MKRLITLLLIVVVILFAVLIYNKHISYFSNKISSSPMLISPQEAKSRRFGLILDVRSQQERKRYGAYPNSVLIPLEELTEQSINDLVSKDTSILIYCKRGNRAGQAAVMLKNWGFKNVKYINKSYDSMMPPGTF